jgi:hypothetical protein
MIHTTGDYAVGPWDLIRRPQAYHVAPESVVGLTRSPNPGVLGIRGMRIDGIRGLANKQLKLHVDVKQA